LEGAEKVIYGVRKLSDFTAIQKGKKHSSFTIIALIGQSASDVFTAADVLIQKTIEFNLKQLYPRAKIIGKLR
jgi:fructose-1,6-bisphosphatase/inositol monophosphatase family enzyme